MTYDEFLSAFKNAETTIRALNNNIVAITTQAQTARDSFSGALDSLKALVEESKHVEFDKNDKNKFHDCVESLKGITADTEDAIRELSEFENKSNYNFYNARQYFKFMLNELDSDCSNKIARDVKIKYSTDKNTIYIPIELLEITAGAIVVNERPLGLEETIDIIVKRNRAIKYAQEVKYDNANVKCIVLVFPDNLKMKKALGMISEFFSLTTEEHRGEPSEIKTELGSGDSTICPKCGKPSLISPSDGGVFCDNKECNWGKNKYDEEKEGIKNRHTTEDLEQYQTPADVPGMDKKQIAKAMDGLLEQFYKETDPAKKEMLERKMRELKAAYKQLLRKTAEFGSDKLLDPMMTNTMNSSDKDNPAGQYPAEMRSSRPRAQESTFIEFLHMLNDGEKK
jgi:uncharacterized Zn finger protein (UPF0148 family)